MAARVYAQQTGNAINRTNPADRAYSNPSTTFTMRRPFGLLNLRCSKEARPMCKIDFIFSKKELKALGKGKRDKLQKHAKRQVLNSPEIHKILLGNPRIRKMIKENPPKKLLAVLRGDLRKKFALSDF